MKKNRIIVLIILIISLNLSINYNIYNYTQTNDINPEFLQQVPKSSNPYKSLYFGVGYNPSTLDPLNCYTSSLDSSLDMIIQVAETLFRYNISDPILSIEPLLVETYFWSSQKDLVLELRDDVWFHDSQKFNATALAWNIDRWIYFSNSSGTLSPGTAPSLLSHEYFLPNGTAIIKGYTINDEFNLTIHLNGAYSRFVSLLTFPGTSIIAPDPVYETEYIDLFTGDLIGTGPFTFENYIPNEEIKVSQWDGYWREPSKINDLIFKIISDSTLRNNELLSGEIDIIKDPMPTLIESFQSDPDIHVEEVGVNLNYYYFAFNNPAVNSTWRKALAHAFNYSHAIENLKSGYAQRGCPAVPEGMPGHNATTQAELPGEIGTFADNIQIARQYMQSMGFGTGWDTSYLGIDESLWTSSSFRTLEVNQHYGHLLSINLNELAQSNWELIGVDINVTEREWGDFLETIKQYPEKIEIWYDGWGPEYLDPLNMLDPLFNNASYNNFIQLNDPKVQDLLIQAGEETNPSIRMEIIMRLQYILFIQEVVHMPLWANFQYMVHQNTLTGLPYNILNYFYFYPCNTPFSLPGRFSLLTDADYPDLDGTFTLNWSDSLGADNYSVSYEIGGSAYQLAEMITETEFFISDFPSGIYIFSVEAINQHGTTSSDTAVVIYDLDPNKRSSIYDGLYLNYSVYEQAAFGHGEGELGLNYTYSGSNIFQVNYTLGTTTGSYSINNFTRTKTQSWFLWMYGFFTPFWIFSNQEIGDSLYLDTPGEYDCIFNITGETIINIPNFLPFDCWVLNSTKDNNSYAYYEKDTGILVQYFSDIDETSNLIL